MNPGDPVRREYPEAFPLARDQRWGAELLGQGANTEEV